MSWISGNYYLNQSEMENNALMVLIYGRGQGWTDTAIAAILGNMQSESSINPGIWESLTPYSGGYGLCQWTPYTKYSDWWGLGWENNGDAEMQRISYEAANDLQWSYNYEIGMAPPYSLEDFLTNTTDSVSTLANYWCWFYEHPANPNQPARAAQAQSWYQFIQQHPLNFPIWLMAKINNERRQRST